jgi:hypothetical protein
MYSDRPTSATKRVLRETSNRTLKVPVRKAIR